MKKSFVLFLSIALLTGFAACGKKGSAPGKGAAETKEAAAASTAAAEKELGIKPGVAISMNLKSIRNSPVYSMVKDKIESQIGKTECVKKVIESVDSIVLMGSPKNLGGKVEDDAAAKKDESIYMVMHGTDAKAALACMKESKEGVKDGKLNGVDALTFEDDGQTGYVWAGSEKTVVMVGGKYAEKVTPGKDMLGKGEVKPFGGDKSIAFTVGEIEEVKEASGFVDFSKGLMADVSVTLKDEAKAKMAETQYEGAKKQADQIPIPGVGDMIKSLKFVRNGATISVQLSLSSDQVKQLMDLAKGMGGMGM
ncbi:hypothetical protein KKD52_09865 [Myxococcota bacterium]|nr:hypothetical protein [Myxococcota bacterium]MBU1410825.1 hypothetical protein [Myxococcota bacterium]MBU1510653.1 hypothetical protein [Myxococcota bacterium]